MFKKVFLSLCASLLIYGCSNVDPTTPPIAPPIAPPTGDAGTINVIATNNATGAREYLPTVRPNVTDLSTPESIVVRGTDIYISNRGGAINSQTAEGFISKYDGTNTVKLTVTPALDDPKGFAFMKDDFVFVSNHPNVTLMKIKADGTYEEVSSLPVAGGAGFLNDVVALNDTTALVSDTAKGMIHKVTIKTDGTGFDIVALTNLDAKAINGVNGLAYNATTKMLYLVTSTFGGTDTQGDLYSVQLDDSLLIAADTPLTKLNTGGVIGASGLDGLVFIDDNKKLVISDWGVDGAKNAAKIFIFDIATKTILTTIEGGITAAADITVDGNTLYIPEFNDSKMLTIDISTVK